LSKAKQNDIPRIRTEKNPGRVPVFARDPYHLCQLPQRHAVLMGCEQSALGVLCVIWIVQAARRDVLLPSRSRTISRPQPCKFIILYVCGYCGRHLPCGAPCMSGVRSGGAGAAEKKKLALFLAPPIVLLPPFVCRAPPSMGSSPSGALPFYHARLALGLGPLGCRLPYGSHATFLRCAFLFCHVPCPSSTPLLLPLLLLLSQPKSP